LGQDSTHPILAYRKDSFWQTAYDLNSLKHRDRLGMFHK